MTFLDLFAGVGGFRRGMELAGHKCVGFCEWDRFATASYTSMHLITEEQRKYLATLDKKARLKEILKEEYRNGEWYSNDIRNVYAGNVPRADCWCFGAPCQDFSVAGHRAGMEGDRSSLVREVFRILKELPEENRPEWLIYENVLGMLSSNKGWDYLAILSEMDEGGYDAEWQVFNSKYHGVPQNRERVYTIGHLRRFGPTKILPITGTDGEDCYEIKQIGEYGSDRKNPNHYRVYDPDGISPTLNTMAGGGREPHIAEAIPSKFGIDYNEGGAGETNKQLPNHEIRCWSVEAQTRGNSDCSYHTDCFDVKYIGLGRIGMSTEEAPTICARDYKDPLRVTVPICVGNTNPSGRGQNGNCYYVGGGNASGVL